MIISIGFLIIFWVVLLFLFVKWYVGVLFEMYLIEGIYNYIVII